MTPQIKQRIDQLRRGEVPEGYKKTKVGIVPSDWEENNLGKYLHEYRELSNDIAKYPVYSSSRQGLIPQSQYYDNREAVETNLGYKIVPTGYVTYRHMSDDDIFHFNINNTGGEVLVSSEYPVFTSTQKGELGYIIPLLNHTARFRYFCRMQKMGGTRTRLYYKNLCEFKAALPPLAEQKKIAEILSAQDKLIALKEKLIEEKKRQKKYLMQQLLTGKKRLPGFSGEWSNKRIAEVCDILDTYRKPLNSTERSGRAKIYPYYGANGIVDYIDEYLIDDNVILLAEDGGNFEDYSQKPIAYWVSGKCWVNNHAHVLKPKKDFNDKFIFYSLEHKDVRLYINGTTRSKLTQEDLLSIVIAMPNDVKEQETIAEILISADREIGLLQKELDQEKQKKKALMQLLLSGVVRV